MRKLCGIAERLDVRPEQLALAWVLRNPEVTSVITGATSTDHVRSNLGAVELEITDATAAEMEALFPA